MCESDDARGGGVKGGTRVNALPWIERFSTLMLGPPNEPDAGLGAQEGVGGVPDV